jgi:hypothetical protein
MVATLRGDAPRVAVGAMDEFGHRDYTVTFLVDCDITDGPANVMQTPGLPLPGSIWQFDNDLDVYAHCQLKKEVNPLVVNSPCNLYEVVTHFSTRPLKRCNEIQFDNPIFEPQRLSGGANKYTIEATKDMFDKPILNSAHEQIRGPQIEFDHNRPTVHIEQNVAILDEVTCTGMIDTVNDDILWGYAPRCVKLSNFTWERLYYGVCYIYYKRVFDFEINPETWDRKVLDQGTKVLNGHWDVTTGLWTLDPVNGEDPDRNNPTHFRRAIDFAGNPTTIILNGRGEPYVPENTGISQWTDSGAGEYEETNPPDEDTAELVTPPDGVLATLLKGGVLEEAVTYLYLITACDDVGETLPSDVVVADTTATQKSVRLTWNSQDGALEYRIYRRSAAEPEFRLIATTLDTTDKPGMITVAKYSESNFLLLDIPDFLE